MLREHAKPDMYSKYDVHNGVRFRAGACPKGQPANPDRVGDAKEKPAQGRLREKRIVKSYFDDVTKEWVIAWTESAIRF